MTYLTSSISWNDSFTNIQFGKNRSVGKYFFQNITKLYSEKPVHKQRKVIIIGSLLVDKRFDMDIVREVNIYNSLIENVMEKYHLVAKEIWYKPHPRLDYKSWLYKQNNMNCNIYDYDDNVLGEVELCNPHLKAVYSVGSTTLLNAIMLFGKEAYLIDIRNEPVHPAAYKKYYYILKKYGIKVI